MRTMFISLNYCIKYNLINESVERKQDNLRERYVGASTGVMLQTLLAVGQEGNKVDDQSAADMHMYIYPHPEYCSIKFTNAYSYAFDLILDHGIHRLPET
jgi:hypothetical protein